MSVYHCMYISKLSDLTCFFYNILSSKFCLKLIFPIISLLKEVICDLQIPHPECASNSLSDLIILCFLSIHFCNFSGLLNKL